MSFDPVHATGSQIAAAIRARHTTARAVAEILLERIGQTHDIYNAFTLITAERALAEAERVDAVIENGGNPGPLAGVPFAVKNLCDLRGEITVAGSKINRGNPPALSDATAVGRLNAAGAICLGALNMGEYAYDFVTENVHDGATCNPRDTTRSAGGSSGGSGAAIAAGLVALALGSDTNGSIRVPSSFCGVWGLRPTYGAVSRGGTFPFVDSLDTIGPFARSVADLAAAFGALAGPDSRDDATIEQSLAHRPSIAIDAPPQDLRVARLGGYFATGGDAVVHAAADRVAEALGASDDVILPEPELARTSAYLITAAESGLRHLDRLRDHATDFDPLVRERLFSGAVTPGAWYLQAQRFRSWWRVQLAQVFARTDVLIAPATPLRAPLLGQETLTFNGRKLPLRPNIGLFTQPVSLIGLPIVAAPVQIHGELPCAVQLIAAPHREAQLFQVARTLERQGICSAPVADDLAVTS